MSIRLMLLLAAATAAVVLALPSVAGAAPAKLVATVGPDETIRLTTTAGARVRTLKAGLYTIVVRDRSAEHNFMLRGAGVSKTTSIEGTGTSTWRVKIARGKTYTFICGPHADHMRGSFRGR
jgi:hypothetical protein